MFAWIGQSVARFACTSQYVRATVDWRLPDDSTRHMPALALSACGRRRRGRPARQRDCRTASCRVHSRCSSRQCVLVGRAHHHARRRWGRGMQTWRRATARRQLTGSTICCRTTALCRHRPLTCCTLLQNWCVDTRRRSASARRSHCHRTADHHTSRPLWQSA